MAKLHTVLFAGLFMVGLAGCGSSQSTAPAPQTAEATPPAPAPNEAGKLTINPGDFEAWLSRIPGESPSLHVEGKMGAVTAPSAGWTVTLQEGDHTAGARTKVLELYATAPSDAGAAMMTKLDVSPYVEDPAKASYNRVTIWYGQKHFTVRVRTVTH
jgi:hypothetical protein